MWQVGEVVATHMETPRVRTLTIEVPDWKGHRPGQHVDLRLTAEDGYQAVRSYSIASAPEEEALMLTVERLEDGEVSPYLVEEVRAGDLIELRGPIGGYFVWEAGLGGPTLLVAGGSGVVPLRSMIRHRQANHSTVPAHLLYSSRSWEDVIYRDELEAAAGDALQVTHTLTRSQPPGWTGHRRRIDREMLAEVSWPPEERPLAYLCGPTRLVESVADAIVELGHDPARIRAERFGPTGR